MGEIVSAECEQPGQESKQADVGGELRSRIPTGTWTQRHLQITSRNGGRKPVGKPDSRGHRLIAERIGAGAHEDPRSGTAWLDFRQLEIVTGVSQPCEVCA